MEPSQPLYEYTALVPADAIRILILLPAEKYSDNLAVRLIHSRSLQEPDKRNDPQLPPYEAVSYAWGEPNFSRDLTCEGRIIKITPPVDGLLRRLRKSDHARSLWIDSVCINQQDEREKNGQVRIMGQIYKKAQKVHVWLGEADEKDDVPGLFNLFEQWGEIHWDSSRILGLKKSGPMKDVIRMKKELNRFLARPWFSRRWILQEVVLAQDTVVRCGAHKKPWLWFTRSCRLLTAVQAARPILNTASTRSLETIEFLRRPTKKLLDIMFQFHASKCSDPRDRIFALCGMANDFKDLPIQYEARWEDLYVSFARRCIEDGHFMTILQHVIAFGSLSEHDPDVPSWVPNWKRPRSAVQRFSLIDTPLRCELRGATNSVDSRDMLRRAFRDLKAAVQQNGFNNFAYTTLVKNHGGSSKSNRFLENIGMALRLSQNSTKLAGTPDSFLQVARILSLAIMDMRLRFETRKAVQDFANTFFVRETSHDGDINASHLTAEHADYHRCQSRIEKMIHHTILQTFHQSTTNSPLITHSLKKMVKIAKLLEHYHLFYTRIDTKGGPYYVPGISPTSVHDGDFLMMPRTKYNDLDFVTTAFLMRPAGHGLLCRTSRGASFRIIGICFVSMCGEHVDEEVWTEARGPDEFIII